MNDTETIFLSLLCFGGGYAIAFSAKNVGRIYRQWGLLLSYLFFPAIFFMMLYLALAIENEGNPLYSTLIGLGFLIRMVKKG